MAFHSWELPERDWEAPDGFGDEWASDSDDEGPSFDQMTPELAGEYLYEQIVSLKLAGTISAKSACLLCFWASRAGVAGPVAKLAMAPDKQSGKYSRKFDDVEGRPQEDGFLYVDVPVHHRCDSSRVVMKMPTTPPHAHLSLEWAQHKETLRGALACSEQPPCYLAHRIYRQAPANVFVWPFSIYLDGVQFTREDSVLGIWVICHITFRRFLVCSLRKSELCTCGCRGWCSLRPLMDMMHWSCQALARGQHPLGGPAGAELPAELAALAGNALRFRACCLFIKGDWMEYACSLGFPTWKSVTSPCMMCWCTAQNAYNLRNLSVLTSPWPAKTIADYNAACDRCEVKVLLHDALWRKLRAFLVKSRAQRGRVLALDVPEARLLKGDRLEPSCELPDVAVFNSDTPSVVTFWRVPENPVVHHRNPIFDAELGITPDESLVVDQLHALCLGVFKYFLGVLLWALFAANIFQIAADTEEAARSLNAIALRASLFGWCKTRQFVNKPAPVKQIQTMIRTLRFLFSFIVLFVCS